MKKLLIMLTMCLLLLPINLAFAAPDVEVQSTYGRITAISGNMVTVDGTGYVSKVTLTAADEGYIRDGQNGAQLDLSALSVGMPVSVYYTPAMTRNNPPQTKSLAIITGNSLETAKYFQVGSVEHFMNESRVLDVNKTQYVTIKDSIFPYPSYLTRGMELLVWYTVSTMSMPGQATATKAMNIYHDKIDINVSLQAGVAAVKGKEIQLTRDAMTTSGVLYLPVRPVSEALGFTVDWSSTQNTIIIKNVVFPVSLTVGSNVYQRDNESITLNYPPIISNGTTLVPVEFFTHVLGATVDINNNHV